MKKKTGKSGRYFWALIILAAAALLLGFYQEQLVMAKAPEQEDIRKFISFAPDVSAEMYDSDYWAEKYGKSGKLILNEQEIRQLQDAVYHSDQQLLHNIWEEGYPEKNNMSYGICVKRTGVMELPEDGSPEGSYIDENQLTAVRINTPVLVDDCSADAGYYHILMYDYEGWVPADCIALCSGREEWLDAQEMENQLVITAPRLSLEITGELLTMGTRLRLLTAEESEETEEPGSTWGCYTVQLPIRQEDGSYGVKNVQIPYSDYVHAGYLPFTTRNLLKQMFRFLGNSYGWGGMYDSVDCSALVQEVMACFGLDFPRDAQNQILVPGERIEFDDTMTEKERKKLLDTLPPGTLLYFPGHIMFYLGKEEGQYYVLSALSSACMPEENFPETDEPLNIRRVIINTLELRRKNGNSWLDELTEGLRL